MALTVLIEGLPGAGKSTTAKSLCEELAKRAPATWFHEGAKDNPVGLPWSYECARDTLAKTNPQEYPFATWSEAIERHDGALILESRFLQNSELFSMLMADEGWEAGVLARGILERLSGAPACLVLLQPTDARAHVERTIAERIEQYPNWLPFVCELFEWVPWCRRRGLEGRDAFVEALVAWDAVQRELVSELAIPTFVVRDPSVDWDTSFERILRFVGSQAG